MNGQVILGMKKKNSLNQRGSEIIVEEVSIREKEQRNDEIKKFTGSMYSEPDSSRV